jgi:hypothetical protein
MIFARLGNKKQTRRVSELKYIIFIENNDYPNENYNNYIKLSIVFHPMIIFRK